MSLSAYTGSTTLTTYHDLDELEDFMMLGRPKFEDAYSFSHVKTSNYNKPISFTAINEQQESDTIMAMMVLSDSESTIQMEDIPVESDYVPPKIRKTEESLLRQTLERNARKAHFVPNAPPPPLVEFDCWSIPKTFPIEVKSNVELCTEEKEVKKNNRLIKNRNSANASRKRRSDEMKSLQIKEKLYDELLLENKKVVSERNELLIEKKKVVSERNELKNKVYRLELELGLLASG